MFIILFFNGYFITYKTICLSSKFKQKRKFSEKKKLKMAGPSAPCQVVLRFLQLLHFQYATQNSLSRWGLLFVMHCSCRRTTNFDLGEFSFSASLHFSCILVFVFVFSSSIMVINWVFVNFSLTFPYILIESYGETDEKWPYL